jgi:hypothetical protein
MRKVGRLVAAAAGLAAIAIVAVQIVVAAPSSAKPGTSYYTTEGADVGRFFTNVATMQVPPGRFHITASILVENFHYGPDAGDEDDIVGPAIRRLYCQMNADGITVGGAEANIDAGGFESMVIDGVVDASRASAAVGVWIYLDCQTEDLNAIPPWVGANLVADTVSAIVDLRQQ